ncbi:MAG: hypothetical protein Q8R28_23240 [Dehalococcoidia bacterium]|nr:hypothetical protein [Dehalococcoidia bacterium]
MAGPEGKRDEGTVQVLFTQAQIDRINWWLTKYMPGDRRCPQCETGIRKVTGSMVTLLATGSSGQGVMMGPANTPAVMIACENCGRLELFSAKRMGLV